MTEQREVTTRLRHLIRLYPRRWRQRYGDEFADLVTTLASERPGRLLLALDLTRGALDAHLNRRYEMRKYLSDVALRRGFFDGLIIAAVMAVVVGGLGLFGGALGIRRLPAHPGS